ncbi:MAG: hypothetical protein JNM17_39915 [Archangium sp.]|nr:hypothetical protein [Archangium sp.]
MFASLVVLALIAVKPTAVVDAERLYVADADGTVRVWNRKTLEFDAAQTKKMNGDGLLAIARDGETLWGFDGSRAFTWDPNGARWDLQKGKPPPMPCSAFAVVGGKPVGTCGPGVHRFTDGKYWDAPEFNDQVKGRGFGEAPHAIAASGNVLAIGTGFGEWGGHLWLLDVSTGKWSKFYDSLGNAVGIAKTEKGWVVAWSMSHMMAHARLRLHDDAAKEVVAGAELRDRYVRTLTFDSESKAVVGLEQQDLVKVTEKLGLEKVQSAVGQVKYGPERNAVGVSPGIGSFIALGGGRYVIVGTSGPPLVVGGGKSVSLVAPSESKPDAGK